MTRTPGTRTHAHTGIDTAPGTLPPGQRGGTRTTVESVIDGEAIERFYGLYVDAFGPLRTAAVARHVLHEDEFLDEMVNPLIDKYVTWDAAGRAVALATLTQHLETVPWISPDYFAHHYPEATARGAVFYLGIILTDPGRQRQRLFTDIVEAVISRVSEARGVCGWDLCALNAQVTRLGDVVTAVSQDISPVDVQVMDTQTYYVGIPEVTRPLLVPGAAMPQMRRSDAP